MDFFSKIKETYLSLPFFLRILIGIGFCYILPPLGIGLIILAVVLRRKDRYGRNSGNYYNYESQKETGKDKKNIYDDKKFDEEFSAYEKKMNKDGFRETDNHIKDLKSAEKILGKTKEYMKKGSMREDMKGIYSKMNTEFENAKKISLKINEMNKILSDPDWNLDKIRKTIQREKNKSPQDPKRIDRINEMLSHIQQLHERKSRLCNQISDLNISFQTIYTKLTLLDIQEEGNFDEIETEIQRILDFQLKVDKYEDKLDRELKEFM